MPKVCSEGSNLTWSSSGTAVQFTKGKFKVAMIMALSYYDSYTDLVELQHVKSTNYT